MGDDMYVFKHDDRILDWVRSRNEDYEVIGPVLRECRKAAEALFPAYMERLRTKGYEAPDSTYDYIWENRWHFLNPCVEGVTNPTELYSYFTPQRCQKTADLLLQELEALHIPLSTISRQALDQSSPSVHKGDTVEEVVRWSDEHNQEFYAWNVLHRVELLLFCAENGLAIAGDFLF